MHAKHGLQSSLRMPGKSLLSFLLFFLVMALLGTSLGVTVSVRNTLKALNDSYSTIAVVDYVADEDPDPDRIRQVAEKISALPLPDAVLRWSPEQVGQCYLPDQEGPFNAGETGRFGVLVMETRTPETRSDRGTMSAAVKQVLFSTRDVDQKLIEVYWPGIKENTAYLAYGEWYTGKRGIAGSLRLRMEPLELTSADEALSAAGAQTYLDLARQLEVRTDSVTVAAPPELSVYLPFQQNSVQILRGRSFTAEEAASGARVCLLSERLANRLNCDVGDSLPLSIAAGDGCRVMESYDPLKGFDLSDTFTVAGILTSKDLWENYIFIPPQQGLDLSRGGGTSTVGQFHLRNEKADAFLQWAEHRMPDGARLTVYDQGYADAAQPIRTMLRTVSLITAACVLVALCFLVLNLWLFVSRQKRSGLLMHRLGVSGAGVAVYFVSALLPVALPSLALGVWFSLEAGRRISDRIAVLFRKTEQSDLRFSDARLNLRQNVAVVQKPAAAWLYLLIAAAVLLSAVLLCLFFARGTVPRLRGRRRRGSLRTHTRTRSLSGGAIKYALLAAQRGGFRAMVGILAPLAAAVLFCVLASTSAQTKTQLRDLTENTTIRGYFSNLNGTSAANLMVKYPEAFAVGDLKQTVRMTGTAKTDWYYDYVGTVDQVFKDDTLPMPELPTGPFLSSILSAERRTDGCTLVTTNSMTDVPQLMYTPNRSVEWFGGYSDEILQSELNSMAVYNWVSYTRIELSDAMYASWEERQEITRAHLRAMIEQYALGSSEPCVVSEEYLAAHGLRLGDEFILSTMSYDGDDFHRAVFGTFRRMRAVGSYPGVSKTILYVPFYFPFLLGENGEELRFDAYVKQTSDTITGYHPDYVVLKEYWEGLLDNLRLASAVYRFRASELTELKQALSELDITEVGERGSIRKPFVLEDQTFLAAKRSIEQRLWYMERTFPVVVVLTELLALILSVLLLLSRRKELRIMHLTGTGKGRALGSVFFEQLILCPLGAVLGLLLAHYLKLLDRTSLIQTGVFAGLWLLGSLASAIVLVRRPSRAGGAE